MEVHATTGGTLSLGILKKAGAFGEPMLEQAPGQKLFSEELHPRGRTHAGTALQEG